MPAAKDGLNPQDRALFSDLRSQYPAGFLVKIGVIKPGLATPEPIMATATDAVHRCSGEEFANIENWMLTRPGVVGGMEYSVQVWPDKGDSRPRGVAKAHVRIALPSAVEQQRIATESRAALVGVELEQAKARALDNTAEAMKAAEDARQAMADEAAVLAAAKANPAGTDPAVVDAAIKRSQGEQARFASLMEGFSRNAMGLSQILARTPAAAPAPVPAVALPAYPTNPYGNPVYPAPYGQPQQQYPVNPFAPPPAGKPEKVDGGWITADGRFVSAPTGAPNAEIATIREEMRRMADEAKRREDAQAAELNREREARREAERKAEAEAALRRHEVEAAKAEAERREQAARHEAEIKSLKEAQERQNAEMLRRLDERARVPQDDGLRALLPVLLANGEKSAAAAIAAVKEAAAANAAANDKIVTFMRENQSPDQAEQMQRMLASFGEIRAIEQGMHRSIIQNLMQMQPKQPSAVAEGLGKLSEAMQTMAIAAFGAAGPKIPSAAESGEVSGQGQAPAPQLPAYQAPPAAMPAPAALPAPAPDIGSALVAEARRDAAGGDVETALLTLQVAFKKTPGLLLAGESPVGAVIRLLDGHVRPEVLAQIARAAEGGPPAAPAPSNVTELRPEPAPTG